MNFQIHYRIIFHVILRFLLCESACSPFVIIISILLTHQHHHHHHFFSYRFALMKGIYVYCLFYFYCIFYYLQERTEQNKTQIWYHFVYWVLVYYANHPNDFRNKSAKFFSAFPILQLVDSLLSLMCRLPVCFEVKVWIVP